MWNDFLSDLTWVWWLPVLGQLAGGFDPYEAYQLLRTIQERKRQEKLRRFNALGDIEAGYAERPKVAQRMMDELGRLEGLSPEEITAMRGAGTTRFQYKQEETLSRILEPVAKYLGLVNTEVNQLNPNDPADETHLAQLNATQAELLQQGDDLLQRHERQAIELGADPAETIAMTARARKRLFSGGLRAKTPLAGALERAAPPSVAPIPRPGAAAEPLNPFVLRPGGGWLGGPQRF